LNKLLENWLLNKDSSAWVLATIIATDGSSYRKSGAMMMINDMGQYYGMLSGGCLESDIMRQARRCWDDGCNRIVEYDMREEEDLAWQLGIGCGGMVRILLQPVNAENYYLQLDLLFDNLQQNQACHYKQKIHEKKPENEIIQQSKISQTTSVQSLVSSAEKTFIQCIKPAPQLAIFGAGVDARPLVAMAAELGWQVLLIDPRQGYARERYFPSAQQIITESIDSLQQCSWLKQLDMVVIMSHNIKLDALALALVQHSNAKYIGMLGPIHRTKRVLDCAGLSQQDLSTPLANPVGLRLGGELPESIALSILAEAHAFIENSNAYSISGILKA
jgi:xanthine/CO dehydrogenase XdhC/CoxF family maturation factor